MTNKELLKIAEQFGTPTYVYDADSIKTQYEKLTSSFHKTTRFFYACKALSNINILKYVQQLGAGLDCVSINEVKLGLKAGFPKDKILFTPNCVDLSEIEEAMSFKVHINIDNISILEQFGNKFGGSYPIFVRINPHIYAGGNHKISTGHIDSKFGISIHQLRHIERIMKSTKLLVEGLHMHTGSEIKDPDVFLQGLEIMFELADHFPDLKYLDMGSGFKVPYQESDMETDVKTLGKKVEKAISDYEKESGKKFQLWFEPGKFLVSKCGHLLVKTNVIKHTTATTFAGVDSGFNHLIRPMFYDSYHIIENISNPKGSERIYTVVGNICETDTFAWDRKIPEIHEGDILVFRNAGAYGFEMSSNFNSRLKPAEVLYLDKKAHLIRKRDEFEDLLKNQIEVL
ncbi:diaminopimelate decarboxylase [Chryseobacterium koreense]|uniref:Diaminopimelate decarboxylase n=1 Tax=Chryseobacterium koreense CCUG 49689 TaxID=1304281 RepID=A0A0J7J2E2_9FLAO|nr:diaminopimelate decarboxylase [Chryseobacterium koreense]KMQ72219.1 diaminopimelate decarboxylase [Chryseobacterium koreense CCUG 49689]MBB5332122.1 diaminopimelate decarboxylase [Chryseobacterium koreense]